MITGIDRIMTYAEAKCEQCEATAMWIIYYSESKPLFLCYGCLRERFCDPEGKYHEWKGEEREIESAPIDIDGQPINIMKDMKTIKFIK